MSRLLPDLEGVGVVASLDDAIAATKAKLDEMKFVPTVTEKIEPMEMNEDDVIANTSFTDREIDMTPPDRITEEEIRRATMATRSRRIGHPDTSKSRAKNKVAKASRKKNRR